MEVTKLIFASARTTFVQRIDNMPADPFPFALQPMLPTLVKIPFSNPDWIFEPKWDGYRAICFLQNGSVRFESKNRKSLTRRFPDLRGVNRSIKAETAIIDGEIVTLDKGVCLALPGCVLGKSPLDA